VSARLSPTGWNDRDAVLEQTTGLEPSLWACPGLGCDYTVRLWKPAGSLYIPTCPDHPEFLCAPWDGSPRPHAPSPPPRYVEPL
jgi:hypothetical protein